jgi:hypothetical protein
MAQGQQASLASTLQANYNQYFANQSEVLGRLNNIFTPIAQAGPDQQGFGAQELAALNTGAMEGVGANYTKASQALNTTLASRGGGNEFLPNGAKAALKATLASSAANEMSRQQQKITEANYAQGRKNFEEATAGLDSLAKVYSPTAIAEGAQEGFKSSFAMADKIQQERNQKQASIAGGITALGLDAATFGAGGLANLGTGESFGEGLGDFFKGGLSALGGK